MVIRKPQVRPAHYDLKRAHLCQAAALYHRAYERSIEDGIPPGGVDELQAFEQRMLRAAIEFAAVARDTDNAEGRTLQ